MSKWISVKDRLPEDELSFCTRYLVTIRTHGGTLPKGYYEFIEMATFVEVCDPDSKDHWPGNTAYWEFCGNEQDMLFNMIYH